jgi:hypothetical protein
MSFRISGLNPESFSHLFGLSDTQLAAHRAIRMTVTESPGFPERIELRDAEVGDTVLLVNYLHLDVDSPYRSSHAVFVREGATAAYDACDVVPKSLYDRQLSLRAFDAGDMLIAADLAQAEDIEARIQAFLANPEVSYIHAHYARHGCYAARIDRA